MSGRGRRLVWTAVLLLSVVACDTGNLPGPWAPTKNAACLTELPPLKSLDVSIEPQQSEQLALQLKAFARLRGYTYKIAVFSADGEDFAVWMHGPGILVVVRSPFNRGEFSIDFYNQDCDHPTTAKDLQDEVQDLMRLLEEIPGIEIVEST
jgi:hypothetical protein